MSDNTVVKDCFLSEYQRVNIVSNGTCGYIRSRVVLFDKMNERARARIASMVYLLEGGGCFRDSEY
jgi:hypothetical protein